MMNTKRNITIAAAFVACALTMAATGTVQAQQLYRQGDCIFAGPPAPNQSNLQGCYGRLPNGRILYLHVAGIYLDVQSNNWLMPSQNGLLVYTNRGLWEPIMSVQNGLQLLAALQADQPQGTTFTFGTPWEYAQLLQGTSVRYTRLPNGEVIAQIPPMPAYGPGGGFPGAGTPNSGGGFHTPDCRNQRGAPCPGVYDPTPHGDVNTNRDFNPNNRPGNRPR